METKLYSEIDEYNLLRLIYNIFCNLINKISLTNEQDIKADKTLREKKALIENFKSNFCKFIILNKNKSIEDKDIGIFYTNYEDILKQNSINTLTEQDNVKLSNLLEEELKNFVRENKDLFPTINNNSIDENFFQKNQQTFFEIFSLLNENLEIYNAIFAQFKQNHTENKQNLINEINQKHAYIIRIIEKIKYYIIAVLFGEQNFKSLDQIKENLLIEQNDIKTDIKILREKIKKFTDQGEEMNALLLEYKKICSMIECMQLKKK